MRFVHAPDAAARPEQPITDVCGGAASVGATGTERSSAPTADPRRGPALFTGDVRRHTSWERRGLQLFEDRVGLLAQQGSRSDDRTTA